MILLPVSCIITMIHRFCISLQLWSVTYANEHPVGRRCGCCCCYPVTTLSSPSTNELSYRLRQVLFTPIFRHIAAPIQPEAWVVRHSHGSMPSIR